MHLIHLTYWTSLVAQTMKNPPAMWQTQVQSLGGEDSLEKEMATHSRIFAWEVTWTEESGGLQSMVPQRVRYDWVTELMSMHARARAHTHAHTHTHTHTDTLIYVPHLLYPSLCRWTFRLLPYLGYCKQCCSEHWGACIFLDHVFLWIYALEWDYRVIW